MDPKYEQDVREAVKRMAEVWLGVRNYGELLRDPMNRKIFERAVAAALEGWVPAWELDPGTEGSAAFHACTRRERKLHFSPQTGRVTWKRGTGHSKPRPFEYGCECDNNHCERRVSLSSAAFDELRENGLFIVVGDCLGNPGDRTVFQRDGYRLVRDEGEVR